MSFRFRRWLAVTMVTLFSWVVPREERERWRQEWLGELWGSETREPVRRSLGAAPHALFLMKESLSPDMLSRDFHYALRTLVHRPGFVAAAAVTLAIGIGATTALFAVVDAVLLRPLPYGEPDRLVSIFESQDGGVTRESPGPANILDWRARSETLEALAGWWIDSTTLLGDAYGETEEVPSARVTEDFFRMLAVEPLVGRTFTREEVAADSRVTVLSHGWWRRRYGADPSIVGKDVSFKNGTWRVIGVMPASFRVPGTETTDVALYKPWDFRIAYSHLPAVPRDHRFVRTAARLAPGATLDAARAEMDVIAASLEETYPETNEGWSVVLAPLGDALVGDVRAALLVLLGAAGFLFLLACANVTSLLLVRATGRSREMAVRSALGASRTRILRQLAVECLLLASLGGATGAALAWGGLGLVTRLAPDGIPRLEEATLDGRVLFFAFAAAAVAAMAASLLPAVQSAAVSPARALRSLSGSVGGDALRQRLRTTIVVAEVAVAVVLLAGSGLLVQSFSRVLAVEPGFDPDNLLVARMRLDGATYGGGGAHPYYTALLEKLRALPGVVAAGGTTALEMDALDVDFERPYWREGEPRPPGGGPGVQIRMATVGYFEAMRIPRIAGRDIDTRDTNESPRVIVINETMAERTWPGESPLGRRVIIDYRNYQAPYEVVGVIGDTRFYGFKNQARPAVYIPHAQNPYLPLNVVIRTASEPASLAPAVRRAVLELDPNQPVHSIDTMDRLMIGLLGRDRFAVFLMTLFAAIALTLATIGLYGVVAYSVSQRRRELGLRVALGADRNAITRLVLGDGARIVLAGIVLGLTATLFLGRFLTTVLFDVSPTDTTTLTAAIALAVVTVLGACYLPARQAARLDPTTNLRTE